MRTIAKPILLVVVILFVAFAGATLLLNLYLQTQGTRSLLNGQLSDITGTPVSIRGIFGLPVLGIRLSSVTAGENPAQPLLSAESITICPDYLSLLHGQLVIAGIRVNHPVVHLTLGKTPDRASSSPVSSFGTAAAATTSYTLASANSTPSQKTSEADHLHVSTLPGDLLHSLSIRNGEFTLHDANGTPSVALTGIRLDADSHRSKAWQGTIHATQAILADHLIIHRISSSLSLAGDLSRLECKELQATLGGGTLGGHASVALNPMQPAYALSIGLDHASMPQLLADATFGTSSAQGSVSGDLTLSGIAGQGATMQGNGSLLCKEAVIQPVDFLKQIGQLLSIDELQLLRLAEGKCAFRVVSGHLIIDDLLLRSENLILTAKGPLQSTGELDLDSRLLFNTKLTGRLR